MTTVRLNRDTGHYEAQASIKGAVWLGGIMLSLIVSVATYAITITKAYGDVTSDIKLLRQELTLRTAASDAAHLALIARIEKVETEQSAMGALATAVQANTDIVRTLLRNGGR